MNTIEIKKVIEEFLKKMTAVFDDVEILENKLSGQPTFLIKSKDSGLLIGSDGEHLRSINHLIKKIASKKGLAEEAKFVVDVNGYHEENIRNIEERAKIMADRAVSFKTSVELEPMSSYERMLIHSMFSQNPNIKTESLGEGNNRRIVIKYVENKETPLL